MRGRPVLRSVNSVPRAAPLQQSAAQISVTTKYRTASKPPSAAGGQPKATQMRSGAAGRAAARTTIRNGTEAYKKPSLASGVVEQQKTVARSEVPKEGRKNPSAVPKPPTARPTPTLPEPRKGLPEGPTTT
ncbi:uncharacterized protein LOC142777227 [Rhipicephalus microplus]|uniref:uncharacterized protein LOC142777227 n=1 Tax=Rhipicephalus microplus TaxID=6941 RepID=UPI003F6B0E31